MIQQFQEYKLPIVKQASHEGNKNPRWNISVEPQEGSFRSNDAFSDITSHINSQYSEEHAVQYLGPDENIVSNMYRKMSITQFDEDYPVIQSPLLKNRGVDGSDDDCDVNSDPENDATLGVYQEDPKHEHNNTDGGLHIKMLQDQQQIGPVGCQDIMDKKGFRNSIVYNDPGLNQLLNTSNDDRERARIQQEQEKKLKQEEEQGHAKQKDFEE